VPHVRERTVLFFPDGMPVRSAVHGFAACDEAFMPYRHLAVRVLACALRDVSDPAGSQTDRDSARLFFAGSPMLFHWCRVAALDPRLVARRAAGLTWPASPNDATLNRRASGIEVSK
jgi:hypothetical protein